MNAPQAAAGDSTDALQIVTRRIKALGAAGQPKAAVKELTTLAELGLQPDTQAATALVHACARNRNMELAHSVFNELFGA
jgi:pentatricopeptide repeat protein